MILDARKEQAIQLLLDGRLTKTQVASEVGCTRQTLYDWLKSADFSAELDRRKTELKDLGQQMFASKLADAIVGYWNLIQNTENDKVKADGYEYFIDRQLGKVTSRLEVTADAKTDGSNKDILEDELDEWEKELNEKEI